MAMLGNFSNLLTNLSILDSIPGIGPKKANNLLEGQKPADYWGIIVQAYKAVGLTEEDALVQARVARILRCEDYEKGGVKLWNPK